MNFVLFEPAESPEEQAELEARAGVDTAKTIAEFGVLPGVVGTTGRIGKAGILLGGKKGLGNLTKSQQRAIRGLEDQIADHQKKLSDFKANPDAFDNKGFLKITSPELRDKIIQSRIKSLEGQIGTFRKDIDAIKAGTKKVLEKGVKLINENRNF